LKFSQAIINIEIFIDESEYLVDSFHVILIELAGFHRGENLGDFHDDASVVSGNCHVGVVEGEIGTEVYTSPVGNHYASNSKFHGIMDDWASGDCAR
jgi:hypothetical protein